MAGPLPQHLLPDNATIGSDGSLSVAGVDVGDLVETFGTPLFVYDEDHIRARCREALAAFGEGVAYAAKAYLSLAMADIVNDEGLHLDVATGGELHVALEVGMPPERLVMHGNNKSSEELEMALTAGVGRVVVDSFDEIDRIEALVARGCRRPTVLIRVTPGIEAHTHEYLQTGVEDSKFGFGLRSGAAQLGIETAMRSEAMQLAGIHAHIGSQVFITDSFARAIDRLAPFVVPLGLPEFSIGGGLGVAYVSGETAPSITQWAETILDAARQANITARVIAEPGRSIVAAAAITLYSVGTIKEVRNVRTYVAVDGGMSDNPRPVLYGSGYEAFLPRAAGAPRPRPVRIVGKHCESGDVIVHHAVLPDDVRVGDVVATPVTGAYNYAMSSNYNLVPRPAVVFVRDGRSRLVTRRETFGDLISRDVSES